MLKKLAERKLKEYKRWCVIASMTDFSMAVDDSKIKPIDRLIISYDCAVNEVNAIRQAVRTIESDRERLILIDSYLVMDKLKPYEIAKKVGLKKSQYYVVKKQALIRFAELYRDGVLMQCPY